MYLCLRQLVSEEESGLRKVNGRRKSRNLAESIFPQYLFLFRSFGFGPIFTQKQNCIVKVDESLPYLKSTTRSETEKTCPRLAGQKKEMTFSNFPTISQIIVLSPFLPPYFTVIFLSPRKYKKCLFKDVI